MKKPRLTAIGFILGAFSTILAVKSLRQRPGALSDDGEDGDGEWEGVRRLRKSGIIVRVEMRFSPNQKTTPSRRLTVKFQR